MKLYKLRLAYVNLREQARSWTQNLDIAEVEVRGLSSDIVDLRLRGRTGTTN